MVQVVGPGVLLEPAARRYIDRMAEDIGRVNPGREEEVRAELFDEPMRLLAGMPFYQVMAPYLARELDGSVGVEDLRRAGENGAAAWREPGGQPGAVAQAANRTVALLFATREGRAILLSGIRDFEARGIRFPTPAR